MAGPNFFDLGCFCPNSIVGRKDALLTTTSNETDYFAYEMKAKKHYIIRCSLSVHDKQVMFKSVKLLSAQTKKAIRKNVVGLLYPDMIFEGDIISNDVQIFMK